MLELKKNKLIKYIKKTVIKKKLIIGLIIVMCLIAIISFLFFYPNLQVSGQKNTVINVFDSYTAFKYKARYMGKNVTNDVVEKGNVNTSKVGEYILTYTIKKGIFKVVKKRIVSVVDKIPPDITLNGEKISYYCKDKDYIEEGYKVIDNYDGDITDKVKSDLKDGIITYSVKDSSNNNKSTKRILIEGDVIGPSLTLNGNNDIYIYTGNNYKESGVSSIDNCDGDISSSVVITHNINTQVPGDYTVNYESTDSHGNKSSVTRNVHVKTQKIYNPGGVFKNSTIYLTFDDGPSASITPGVLDILKAMNVKATFFVINKSSNLDYLIKRAYDEGHTIALHSSSHNYSYVYSSVENYFNDLQSISNKVKNITGQESKIIRFPGGSSNTVSRKYCTGIMSTLTTQVLNLGYRYFDWNVGSGDAGGANSPSDVYNNVISGLSHSKTNVVLMHDFENNYKTLNALKRIIEYGIDNGYAFSSIDMTTPMVMHSVAN